MSTSSPQRRLSNSYRPSRPSPLSTSASSSDSEDNYYITASRATVEKMSITQTHILARKARSKLAYEASRSNHEMRRLVGHANLLDVLIKHIYEAEHEQDLWFNSTIQEAAAAESASELVSAEDSIGWLPVDDVLYDSSSSEEDYDEDEDDDEFTDDEEEEIEETEEDESDYVYELSRTRSKKATMLHFGAPIIGVKEITPRNTRSTPTTHTTTTLPTIADIESESDEEDDEGLYPLRRSHSLNNLSRASSHHHLPSLVVDDSSSEDDEDEVHNPPSPKQTPIGPAEMPWLKSSRDVPTTTGSGRGRKSSIPKFFEVPGVAAAAEEAAGGVAVEVPMAGTPIYAAMIQVDSC